MANTFLDAIKKPDETCRNCMYGIKDSGENQDTPQSQPSRELLNKLDKTAGSIGKKKDKIINLPLKVKKRKDGTYPGPFDDNEPPDESMIRRGPAIQHVDKDGKPLPNNGTYMVPAGGASQSDTTTANTKQDTPPGLRPDPPSGSSKPKYKDPEGDTSGGGLVKGEDGTYKPASDTSTPPPAHTAGMYDKSPVGTEGGNPIVTSKTEISDDKTIKDVDPIQTQNETHGSKTDEVHTSEGGTNGVLQTKQTQAAFYDFQQDPQYRTAQIGSGIHDATKSFIKMLNGVDIGDNPMNKYMEDTRAKYAEANQVYSKDDVNVSLSSPQWNNSTQESHGSTWGSSKSMLPGTSYQSSPYMDSWKKRWGLAPGDMDQLDKEGQHFFIRGTANFHPVSGMKPSEIWGGMNGFRQYFHKWVKDQGSKYANVPQAKIDAMPDILERGTTSGDVWAPLMDFQRAHPYYYSTDASGTFGTTK